MRSSFTPADLRPLQPVLPGTPVARGSVALPRPKAVVIGSGFGGLAAAIRLSCKGYDVEVFEKLDAPGGRAYVWRQDGYTFDAGPTIVTAPNMFEELWTLCGRRLADDVTLLPIDPFYRIRYDDGTHFDYSSNAVAMRAQIGRIAPEDLAGYDRFVQEAELCYRLGFEQLGSVAYDSLGSLLKAVPQLLRMRGWRSLHAMVASHMRHPKLRMAFSLQSLLIGGNPFSVTCIYSLINALERRFGVHWAMGGTGSLVQGMVKLLQERGVAVHLNAEVSRITVAGSGGGRGGAAQVTGIELADGRHVRADLVVSNGDTAWTYRHLVEHQHRPYWTDKRIDSKAYSMSLFVWYFGTRQQYPDVPHHLMLLGPRYEGLLQDIFKHHRLADDFSLYLHRPTASDPSMAPPGHDAFYVLAPVPHLGSGTDWATMAEPFRRAVQQRLEATVLPGLGLHIGSSRVMTPQDFHDRLLSYKGAAFGMEPVLMQSAYFRPHNASEDVRGLYMVGASTHPGAGVPGVLMSAKALDQVVPHALHAH